MDLGCLDALFVYRKKKELIIDIWQVGMFYRTMQFLIFVYMMYDLFVNKGWAYQERPLGTANVYISSGTSGSVINAAITANGESRAFTYCNNDTYSYEYSAEYKYGSPPKCRLLKAGEVGQKGIDHFFFTTAYTETHFIGWSCDGGVDDTAQTALCMAEGGSTYIRAVGQLCECSYGDTFYPMGVEKMKLAMELSYDVSDRFSNYGGSTNNAVAKADGTADQNRMQQTLEVRLMNQNNTPSNALATRTCDESSADPSSTCGSWIAFTVEDLLAVAGTTGLFPTQVVSLDSYNTFLTLDHRTTRYPNRYPTYRTSGINVRMKIDFVNYDPSSPENAFNALYAAFNEHRIRAELHCDASPKSWAGLGPTLEYAQYPSGPNGHTYHKVERYRQGVVFDFVTVGHVQRFDIAQLVLRLAVMLSLLALAGVVTETLGYWLFLDPKTGRMLKNKARETVTATSEFAEVGMTAAIAATQFGIFDPDGNGKLEHADIATIFTRVDGISAEQAYCIADLVLKGADKDGQAYKSKVTQMCQALSKKVGKKVVKKALTAAQLAGQGLDFYEYISCLQDTIDFEFFVKNLKLPDDVDEAVLKTVRDDFAKADAEKADKATRGIETSTNASEKMPDGKDLPAGAPADKFGAWADKFGA